MSRPGERAPLRPLLVVGATDLPWLVALGRREADIEVRRVPAFPVASALDATRPTVVLLDRWLLASLGGDRARLDAVADVAALVGAGAPNDGEPPPDFPADLLTGFVPGGAATGLAVAQLRGGFRHALALVAARAAREGEQQRHRELHELTSVGAALSTERDVAVLLDMILSHARRMTTSDAGSIYLAERVDEGEPKSLRFKHTQNDSNTSIPFREFTVPIDHSSLAGYTAATKQPLVIADVYLLPKDVTYKQNRSIDEKYGYRTKSMLVIPMTTHRGEMVGVVQLINRKRAPESRLTSVEVVEREVIPFDERSVELVSALASQAAVAIENSLLYEDIERLFEGFVKAAVIAIESRDPTTFGHSGRVSDMTIGLADALERAGAGPYRGVRFSRDERREIRYASLLHDFGKVGVREQVLVKQKKLYPPDLEAIRHRFSYLKQSAELEFERRRADYLLEHGRADYDRAVAELLAAHRDRQAQLDRFLNAVLVANEPTILAEAVGAELQEVGAVTFPDSDGTPRRLLSDDEVRFLTIPRGTLDEAERREIESHVTHTFRFLEQIPWTRQLRGVPLIAFGHHEKLDGTGYPRRAAAPEIPVQTRMMTIADIFDALTASDRPYKRAVPSTRALDILSGEAKAGQLDRHLLDTFVEARVFEVVSRGEGL